MALGGGHMATRGWAGSGIPVCVLVVAMLAVALGHEAWSGMGRVPVVLARTHAGSALLHLASSPWPMVVVIFFVRDGQPEPEVICEPEISITERCEEDDCLILASDGLWDVISNKVACDVARQCLEDGSPTRAPAAGSSSSAPAVSQEEEPRCFRAAAVLARLALGRESSDNISVVVVDLKVRG
ncbi:probable protein phosphatase 2C 37 [Triticum urartu]|uniref:probable protein phosphatase 2C 37 n=1 Tax=Triticum urartu TaxID=4572 RepID=UPI0020436A5C|nr:probable protein phosphatase 2C 37 [Triticum urartu]